MKTTKFIQLSIRYALVFLFLGIYGCKENNKKEDKTVAIAEVDKQTEDPFFKLSLAQWSIHKMILEEKADPYSFAEKAKNMGFTGLEYVSQLYPADLKDNEYSEAAMAAFVEKSNAAPS